MTEKNDTLGFAISALLLSAAIWLFFPENGIVAQIPFICVFPIIIPAFYNKYNYLIAYAFFFSFLSSLLRGETIFFGIIFGFVMAIFIIIGMCFYCFFKKNKVISIVLAIISLLLFTFLSGSFFGNIVASVNNKNYIKDKGYTDCLDVQKTQFSFFERRYMTQVVFYDNNDRIKALISECFFGNNETVDGYRFYIEQKFLEKCRYEISDVLSQKIDFDFASRSKRIDTDNILSLDDDYNSYREKMYFEIAFYKTADKSDFASMVSECLNALNGENIIYGGITFFAGNSENFLYQVKIPYGFSADTDNIMGIITDFDKKSFKDLNKEKFKEERYGY